jgi:hypothetical protein
MALLQSAIQLPFSGVVGILLFHESQTLVLFGSRKSWVFYAKGQLCKRNVVDLDWIALSRSYMFKT